MRRQRITKESVEELRRKLDAAMPEADDTLSKQGVVESLADNIRDMRSRGCTVDFVAQTLSSNGFEITPATLKNYLQRVGGPSLGQGPTTPKTTKRTKRTAQPATPRARATPTPPVVTAKASATVRAATFTPAADTNEI